MTYFNVLDRTGMSQLDIDRAKEYLNRRISPEESYEDLLSFPRFIEIETVNACNARCPMCTIADWQRNTPTMKDDLFQRIADEIIDHRHEVKRVSLYRDGEPLLDKKLPSRVAILKDGGVGGISISTNVSLLTEERSRALLEAGLDMIILSIDSLEKEIFESIRVRLDFEEVLENALKFIELRDRIRPRTKIYMRMIRQRRTWTSGRATRPIGARNFRPTTNFTITTSSTGAVSSKASNRSPTVASRPCLVSRCGRCW